MEWAAKLLQIERLMERKPAQLSGGQRQRVAIGRALVKRAGVLLFDEPLSNLDAKLRTEMRLEIKKLHGELGQTIVYVTHDQIEAMTMATRIAVMDAGVIQQVGTPDEIYETPANLFVARFIGSPAMNIFEARDRGRGRRGRRRARGRPACGIDLSGYGFTPPAGGGDARRRSGSGPSISRWATPTAWTRGGLRAAAALQRAGRAPTPPPSSPPPTSSSRCGSIRRGCGAQGRASRSRASFPRDKLNVFDAGTGRRL